MRQNVVNLCLAAMLCMGIATSVESGAGPLSGLLIQGKVVHVAAGDFWGILGDDGRNYDPGTLPVAFRHVAMKVRVEARLAAKRPARMWGKAIEILQIETQALDADAHAHHRQQEAIPGYQRSTHGYSVPDVDVIDAAGTAVTSASLFDTGKTVVVSFIFTSCTAICPILTATLTQTRQRLGVDAERVRIVSISIDPQYDTPLRGAYRWL
ncbi:MAG: SCO family protein [Gammaproteobacteria bacterium]|nr:SCO family protein [Gammaproteobacteria bacterium]